MMFPPELPNVVIIDAAKEISKFKQDIPQQKDTPKEDIVNETISAIESIISCFQDKERAEYELKEYVAMIELGELPRELETEEVDSTEMENNLQLASAILDFGLAIEKKINELGFLHDEEGNLLYTTYERAYFNIPEFLNGERSFAMKDRDEIVLIRNDNLEGI